MPWIRVTDDADYRPLPRVMQTFRAGQIRLVTTPCAEDLIKRGKAVRLPTPRRGDRP